MSELVDIKFFVDGEPLTSRFWPCVPRKGDEVMLGPHGDRVPFRVRRVVWGVDNPLDNRQAVNIDLTYIPLA